MKIQYMSDLHLEFRKKCLPPVPEKAGDVLVLAGDIHVGTNAIPWIEQCSYNFDKIFYVPGNHEFYGHKMWKLRTVLDAALAGYSVNKSYKLTKMFDPISNVTILDNKSEIYEGVNFIGTTLWSFASNICNIYMNDFKCITHRVGNLYGKFKAEDACVLFDKNVEFIKNAAIPTMPNVVITHHAPSLDSIAPAYAHETEMNTGFATEILHHFEGKNIPVWIHGHTHHCVDYVKNGINVVSNQYGYEKSTFNQDELVKDFSWTKVVEV